MKRNVGQKYDIFSANPLKQTVKHNFNIHISTEEKSFLGILKQKSDFEVLVAADLLIKILVLAIHRLPTKEAICQFTRGSDPCFATTDVNL